MLTVDSSKFTAPGLLIVARVGVGVVRSRALIAASPRTRVAIVIAHGDRRTITAAAHNAIRVSVSADSRDARSPAKLSAVSSALAAQLRSKF